MSANYFTEEQINLITKYVDDMPLHRNELTKLLQPKEQSDVEYLAVVKAIVTELPYRLHYSLFRMIILSNDTPLAVMLRMEFTSVDQAYNFWHDPKVVSQMSDLDQFAKSYLLNLEWFLNLLNITFNGDHVSEMFEMTDQDPEYKHSINDLSEKQRNLLFRGMLAKLEENKDLLTEEHVYVLVNMFLRGKNTMAVITSSEGRLFVSKMFRLFPEKIVSYLAGKVFAMVDNAIKYSDKSNAEYFSALLLRSNVLSVVVDPGVTDEEITDYPVYEEQGRDLFSDLVMYGRTELHFEASVEDEADRHSRMSELVAKANDDHSTYLERRSQLAASALEPRDEVFMIHSKPTQDDEEDEEEEDELAEALAREQLMLTRRHAKYHPTTSPPPTRSPRAGSPPSRSYMMSAASPPSRSAMMSTASAASPPSLPSRSAMMSTTSPPSRSPRAASPPSRPAASAMIPETPVRAPSASVRVPQTPYLFKGTPSNNR